MNISKRVSFIGAAVALALTAADYLLGETLQQASAHAFKISKGLS